MVLSRSPPLRDKSVETNKTGALLSGDGIGSTGNGLQPKHQKPKKSPQTKAYQGTSTENTGESYNMVKVYKDSLKGMCEEIRLMNDWLIEHPRSTSELREFVIRANNQLTILEQASKGVEVWGKHQKEKPSAEQIRDNIKKYAEGEKDLLDELMLKEWPEEVFERVKLDTRHPLSVKKCSLVLILSSKKEENRGILSIAERALGDTDDIIVDGLVVGGFQRVETVRKIGETARVSHVFLLTEEGTNIQRLLQEANQAEIEHLGLVRFDASANPTEFRKMAETFFYGQLPGTEITLFAHPKALEGKKEKKKEQKEKDFEILKISSSKTYAEVAEHLKQYVSPEEFQISDTRKSEKGELLITTKKGETAKLLRNEIINKVGADLTDLTVESIEIIGRKAPMLISGIGCLIEEEDIRKGLEKETGLTSESLALEIKKTFETRGGKKNVEIWINKKGAAILDKKQTIQIGWGSCNVARKVKYTRCLSCLNMGHSRRDCKSKEDNSKKCFNCLEEGHLAAECTNSPKCNVCKCDGHRPDTAKCPAFRRYTHRK
jgi:Arginine methyltransferase-interacting protein, contains RING Zn-finger